ncbi:hypothetical protein GLV94_14230 [Virgibacillus halodenitrificans]|uniref:hypothetical protein n=1 Tax=Virgibacillus halodenitrificans TaxID=1482 RepID=UPI00136F4669|nr:hypothetical protein [Virgibacillus halodenitrificans]MCJ0930288.1 hypothetical protein [Virgibacillus halodenitrificans]MYL46804.1 hypothetical protein [Virgibacillus halodenitrificans]
MRKSFYDTCGGHGSKHHGCGSSRSKRDTEVSLEEILVQLQKQLQRQRQDQAQAQAQDNDQSQLDFDRNSFDDNNIGNNKFEPKIYIKNDISVVAVAVAVAVLVGGGSGAAVDMETIRELVTMFKEENTAAMEE